MKKYFLSIAIVVALFSQYGCYTQVDFRNRQRHDYEYSHDQDRDETYSENDSKTYSNGESDVTINNYYDGNYPGYRRYLWHNYYPSFSLGFSVGPFWDNFCYDPWWYGYYPAIPVIAYYSPYFYDNYYYGGYYNNSYWNGGGAIYKERTNSDSRLRNTDGGRGTTTLRDRTTRNLIQSSLNKDRIRTETLKRDVLGITRGSSPVLRNRDNNSNGSERTILNSERAKRSADIKDAEMERRPQTQPADRNRETIRSDRNSSAPSSDERKTVKPEQRESQSPSLNNDRRNSQSTSPDRRSSNERRKESSGYSAPRRESSQPSYQAPRSSNNGSSSRSSSSSSSRSSGSGNSGSNSRRR